MMKSKADNQLQHVSTLITLMLVDSKNYLHTWSITTTWQEGLFLTFKVFFFNKPCWFFIHGGEWCKPMESFVSLVTKVACLTEVRHKVCTYSIKWYCKYLLVPFSMDQVWTQGFTGKWCQQTLTSPSWRYSLYSIQVGTLEAQPHTTEPSGTWSSLYVTRVPCAFLAMCLLC